VAAGAHCRALATYLAAWLLQLDGVDQFAAAVALIASSVLKTVNKFWPIKEIEKYLLM
jgi:hypothetical protein